MICTAVVSHIKGNVQFGMNTDKFIHTVIHYKLHCVVQGAQVASESSASEMYRIDVELFAFTLHEFSF